MMTRSDRACQMWAALAWAARNRQSLTYGHLADASGVPTVSVGGFLEPIQSYCLLNKLPPLTVLVVSKETGLPSGGFSAVPEAGVPIAREHVFEFDWLKHKNPGPDALERAVRQLPSNGGNSVSGEDPPQMPRPK